MRILFLTQRLPYAPNRGDRIRAYHLMRELSRFADVSLFSLVHDEEEASHAAAMPFATHVQIAHASRVRGLIRGAAQLGTARPLTHALLDSPEARPALARLLSLGNPDLVLAYCSSMARFALEPPLAAIPFVLDMVDVDSAKWGELAAASRPPLRWVYRRECRTLAAFEAAAVRAARNTLVVNDKEKDALRRVTPDGRVVVVQNGIELEAFAPPGDPATGAAVVFCGVMDYFPNVEGVRWFAQQVWPQVTAQRPDATFHIVGANPTSAVRALAERDRSVRVLGRVDQVQPHLWSAAVSVAPLRFARGLQNKVLEALAAGLPVVATQAVIEGLPEEARAGCAPADTDSGFAAAVIDLLKLSPEQRRQRAELAALESLGWRQRLQQLQALVEEAARPRESA